MVQDDVARPCQDNRMAGRAADESRILLRPCRCCCGRMIIIETFAAGCQHIRPVRQAEKPKPPTPVYVRIKAPLGIGSV